MLNIALALLSENLLILVKINLKNIFFFKSKNSFPQERKAKTSQEKQTSKLVGFYLDLKHIESISGLDHLQE